MTNRKTALITGGSRGLGKNMALAIAAKGIDVIITYHTQKEEAEKVVAEIQASGQKAAALQLDTSNISGFDAFKVKLSETLENEFNTTHFDFLVNNAGTGTRTLFTDTSEELFDHLMNIHFKGVFFLTQKLLPTMNDGSSIINISSGLARFSMPGSGTYAAMKGAIETLTKYLAKELGGRQIRANVVAPGAIATDFNGGSVRDNPQVNQMVAGVTALGRAGQAEDIGGVVAFLCTPEAGWINGQRIEVSGGMNL